MRALYHLPCVALQLPRLPYFAMRAGGMKVKADRDEASHYAAMLAAQDVSERCKVRPVSSYIFV